MGRFLYCLITDRKFYRQPLHEVAQYAEEAGVDYFQLREKDLKPAELLDLARHIRPLLVRTRLIVNGHLDVAVATGADGVHLQKENLPIAVVRKEFSRLLIGYSAHSKEEIAMAEQSGADYVFISPVFTPASKQSDFLPLGCETVASWVRGIRIPVFGLGGVAVSNVRSLKQAGCAGAAGISFFVEDGRFSSRGLEVC